MDTSRTHDGKLRWWLAPALALCAVACGDDSSGNATTGPRDGQQSGPQIGLDASTSDASSASAAATDRDGEFGFGDQGVDPIAADGTPIPADPAPTGWSCQESFARDGICDCGCGTKDGIILHVIQEAKSSETLGDTS